MLLYCGLDRLGPVLAVFGVTQIRKSCCSSNQIYVTLPYDMLCYVTLLYDVFSAYAICQCVLPLLTVSACPGKAQSRAQFGGQYNNLFSVSRQDAGWMLHALGLPVAPAWDADLYQAGV